MKSGSGRENYKSDFHLNQEDRRKQVIICSPMSVSLLPIHLTNNLMKNGESKNLMYIYKKKGPVVVDQIKDGCHSQH